MLTKLRSNMNVHSAETASKTRTRPNDIKTRSTFVVIPGLAQLCQVTGGHSIIQQVGPETLTLVAIVVRNSHGLDMAPGQALLVAAKHPDTPQIKTGMSESRICKRCINSESATHRRNFTGPTTSGNI